MARSDKKKTGKSNSKKLLSFLIFQLVFSVLTMPFLVFYGPFDNVKKTVVGASLNTLRHQYIAKTFLTDSAIDRIMKSSFAIDPTKLGVKLLELDFIKNNSKKIDIYNIDGSDYSGKLVVVHDPTRIKVGYSDHIPKAGETTSNIAKRNNAVAAINAGGFMDNSWTGTGGTPTGFIMHGGEVIYDQKNDENVPQDTVAFTEKGMLIVGMHSISNLKKLGVKEAVSFGPPLIVNGEPTISNGDGGWGIAPRTAIGQRETGEVLLLVIDGRSLGSLGATLKDVQDVLLNFGAVNGINLDGGSSTTMYYNGMVINKPSDKLGERTVPSAFLVMP